MATYLLNRRPSSAIQNGIHFSLLYGSPPDYSLLRVFGCLCYPNMTATARHKLAPRPTACVFLGYPSSHKGYRCLDLSTRRIIISRHVVFDETCFPFSLYSPKSSPSDLDFLLAALPCRSVALLPRPPPRLLRHLLTSSDRLLAVLTSRSSPTTPPSYGVVPSSSRDLGVLLRPPQHLLLLPLQHLCSSRPGHRLPSAASTAGVPGTTTLDWPRSRSNPFRLLDWLRRRSCLRRPPAGLSLGSRQARSSLSTGLGSRRCRRHLRHQRPRLTSHSSPPPFPNTGELQECTCRPPVARCHGGRVPGSHRQRHLASRPATT